MNFSPAIRQLRNPYRRVSLEKGLDWVGSGEVGLVPIRLVVCMRRASFVMTSPSLDLTTTSNSHVGVAKFKNLTKYVFEAVTYCISSVPN
jgi:hypothetical protein